MVFNFCKNKFSGFSERRKIKGKLLFLILFCSSQICFAQFTKRSDYGKTYYDSSCSKVCEVFRYVLEYQFLPDKITNEKVYQGVTIIKDGPYLGYYEDGKLAFSGFFLQNEKDSLWKYYSPEGNLIHTELYKNNQLRK